jgi:hypothetical protein
MLQLPLTLQDKAGNAIVTNVPVSPLTHRVSDLGLGVPGSGMFEAAWAKDQTIRAPLPGVGYINLFDGTKWLRSDQSLTLEGAIAPLSSIAYPAAGATGLLYDIDVAASLKNAAGLWLPSFIDDATQTGSFSGLVPTDTNGNGQARSLAEATPYPSSLRLRDFQMFKITDPKAKDGAMVSFLFSLPQGSQWLYAASAPDPAIDPLWYLHVRPWEFQLHDIIAQRGGVQILHNIINPANGEVATLQYSIAVSGPVTVTVFDLAGTIVNVLVRGRQEPGTYEAPWDGTNRSGAKVARGIYFLRIVAPGIDEIQKVLVVR